MINESAVNGSSAITESTSQFENTGNSYLLMDCADASAQISSSVPQSRVELGISPAEIRSIEVGKPRHIHEGVWTFGYDQPVNLEINPSWDLIPTVPYAVGTTASSGDNLHCLANSNVASDLERKFITEANEMIKILDVESHRNEVPDCGMAAKRIAAKVELGMTPDQVRDVVGKPVEITPKGLWRYKFGSNPLVIGDPPIVHFGEASFLGPTDEFADQFFGDTEETGIADVRVLGYWSPVEVCSVDG